MNDPANVIIAVSLFGALAYSVRAIAAAVVQYQEKLNERRKAGLSPTADARLERIEQAVDAMAVEIERISEGQRFTTRLLSERSHAEGADATRTDR